MAKAKPEDISVPETLSVGAMALVVLDKIVARTDAGSNGRECAHCHAPVLLVRDIELEHTTLPTIHTIEHRDGCVIKKARELVARGATVS